MELNTTKGTNGSIRKINQSSTRIYQSHEKKHRTEGRTEEEGKKEWRIHNSSKIQSEDCI